MATKLSADDLLSRKDHPGRVSGKAAYYVHELATRKGESFNACLSRLALEAAERELREELAKPRVSQLHALLGLTPDAPAAESAD